MNNVLKLLLEGEPLDTAQIGKILNLGQAAVESQLADLRKQGVLLGWRAVLNPSFEAERRVRAVIEIKIQTQGAGGFEELPNALANSNKSKVVT